MTQEEEEHIERSRRLSLEPPLEEPPAQRRRLEEAAEALAVERGERNIDNEVESNNEPAEENVIPDESDNDRDTDDESDTDSNNGIGRDTDNDNGSDTDNDTDSGSDNGSDNGSVNESDSDGEVRVISFYGEGYSHVDHAAPVLDTLPYHAPPSKTVDIAEGNMPCKGYTVQKEYCFKYVLVDRVPSRIEGPLHIFLSSYCKDSWQGLEVKETQELLLANHCKVYCSPITAEQLKVHYPALYYELVLKLLIVLEPGRCHVLTDYSEKGAGNLTVHPISVSDVFPGYCMYLFMFDNKTLLHTGVHSHCEDTKKVIQQAKDVVTKLDFLYIDTAVYFPGWGYGAASRGSVLEDPITVRSSSIGSVEYFVACELAFFKEDKAKEKYGYRYISVRFRTGMEVFIAQLIRCIHTNPSIKFCFTRDVYDLCSAEILKISPPDDWDNIFDNITVVDMLYKGNLTKSTADVFFYSEESAVYYDLHNGNKRHIQLRVVYDMHSCMKVLPRSHAIYSKYTGRKKPEKRERNQYIALYPSHPTNAQVDELIKGLQPVCVKGLATAPGVELIQLTEHFNKAVKHNTLCMDKNDNDERSLSWSLSSCKSCLGDLPLPKRGYNIIESNRMKNQFYRDSF